jgi:hypothetical protein
MQAKRSKFNMSVLRRRAKKMMRSKFKKTIKLSDVDKIWKEYVEYGVIKPLLMFGKANMDGKCEIEIVGKKILDDPKTFNLLVKGYNVNSAGKLKEAVKFDGRPGIKYKIVLTDKNYRGNLVFNADPKLSRRVHEELKNTNTYYRICQ